MKKNSSKKHFFLLGMFLVAGGLATITYFKVMYPYGDRVAVLRAMHFALLNYAMDHDGYFPKSEKSSHDALQKLYPAYAPSGAELAGISGNVSATVNALSNNVPLHQGLTSWVYIQGFKKDDDPRIAILWESQGGLYPNGKRNCFGGHAVLFIGGDITNVASVDWDNFLKQQEQLRITTD